MLSQDNKLNTSYKFNFGEAEESSSSLTMTEHFEHKLI